MNENITIVRQYRGVGIDAKLNGYNMASQKPVRKAVYHGRIVYLINGKQVGLPSIRMYKNRCSITFDNSLPF